MYSAQLMNIFYNPQNVGKIVKADMVGKAGSVEDGDVIKLYFRLDNNIVTDCKFETFGCVSAIVASEIVASMAKGKSLEQLKKVKFEDVIKVAGEFPYGKEHGVGLAISAIRDALLSYYKECYKAGKLTEEQYNILIDKPKKSASKGTKKRTKTIKKVVEVEKVEKQESKQPIEQQYANKANKLMLLTKKITTTTTTKNTTK